jgi:hypothetical protein
MNRIVRRAWQRVLRRLSVPGVLALGLLVPVGAILLWLPRLQNQADELRATLAARLEVAARQGPAAPQRKSNVEQTAEYVAAFPVIEQSAGDLEKVFTLARQRNLQLPKGDYQMKHEPKAPLLTYSVTLPLRSEYGALKDFAADVLTALPHASMDEMRMTRADAGSVVLDSMVRFTFVYRTR